ncbi:hypothetical protein K501DRAFT_268045 [Backusella circina FSU 941]|nr:hypothetical protein K501DRAFT_268045 [Backusella circina FSU 941]
MFAYAIQLRTTSEASRMIDKNFMCLFRSKCAFFVIFWTFLFLSKLNKEHSSDRLILTTGSRIRPIETSALSRISVFLSRRSTRAKVMALKVIQDYLGSRHSFYFMHCNDVTECSLGLIL